MVFSVCGVAVVVFIGINFVFDVSAGDALVLSEAALADFGGWAVEMDHFMLNFLLIAVQVLFVQLKFYGLDWRFDRCFFRNDFMLTP